MLLLMEQSDPSETNKYGLSERFYSRKKKRHKHKNLVLTNKEKVILFLSETVVLKG